MDSATLSLLINKYLEDDDDVLPCAPAVGSPVTGEAGGHSGLQDGGGQAGAVIRRPQRLQGEELAGAAPSSGSLPFLLLPRAGQQLWEGEERASSSLCLWGLLGHFCGSTCKTFNFSSKKGADSCDSNQCKSPLIIFFIFLVLNN